MECWATILTRHSWDPWKIRVRLTCNVTHKPNCTLNVATRVWLTCDATHKQAVSLPSLRTCYHECDSITNQPVRYPITKEEYDMYFFEKETFWSVHKTAKSDCQLRPVCLSVRPHGATRLSLDGFSCNFISMYFSKICWENSSFIKLWQE